jgi:hypothetical protein
MGQCADALLLSVDDQVPLRQSFPGDPRGQERDRDIQVHTDGLFLEVRGQYPA